MGRIILLLRIELATKKLALDSYTVALCKRAE